ncbi:SIS domain-containing protein [bacterium]|nr:SIS domain-containing protein [bacterium]
MIETFINDSISVKQHILNDSQLIALIYQAADDCVTALRNGNKIIFAGNGGSFSDAQHISAELVGRFVVERESLPSVTLGTNSSSITAIGNDYGYDQVYARELSSIGAKGDVFFPISTSGNSPNIIEAIKVANAKGIISYGLTGYTGGKMAELCPCIKIPSGATPRIQEAHITIGHSICGYIEDRMFRKA